MNEEVIVPLVILPLLFIIYNFACFLMILIHELSHAIPALLFTKDKVQIYVGTKNTNYSNRFPLKLGRLNIYVKPRFFYVNIGGFCTYSPKVTVNQRIIIILCGTIVTMLIATILLYFAFFYDLHGLIKVITIVFFSVSLISLIYNLRPRYNAVLHKDGTLSYTDGYNIVRLLKMKQLPNKYVIGTELQNQGNYEQAIIKYNELLKHNVIFVELYQNLIICLLQTGYYREAFNIDKQFKDAYSNEWSSTDYCHSGLIKSQLNMIDESLSDYNRSIELDPTNTYALNNIGYSYNLIERYNEAITEFDRALEINPGFAYSYSNRGLAKIKTGQIDDGLKDIYQSILLDDKNAYAYRNLGIYYFDQAKFTEASLQFKKAKELDNTTHGIDDLIEQTNQKILD